MRATAFVLTGLLVIAQQAPFNPQVPPGAPSSAQPRPQDDQPEAYPGQHDHAVPPEGWQCMRAPADLQGDQDHWCSCERTCDQETQVVHEDKKCAVYCHMDHCTCTQNATMKRCMPAEQQ
jgi:hypothetical protein